MARDATDKPTGSPEASSVDLEEDVQLAVLAHNLPKFSAAALSGHILYTLATRGRAGLNVDGLATGTFFFGVMPGSLASFRAISLDNDGCCRIFIVHSGGTCSQNGPTGPPRARQRLPSVGRGCT